MKKNLFEKLALILSVILYLVPNYLAPICQGMKPSGGHMGCYYSGNLVMKFAIFMFIVSLIIILTSKYSFGKIIKIVGSILVIIIAALTYMIPHRIIEVHNEVGKVYRFCGKETMACVVHNTFGVAGIVAGIIAIIMVVNLIYTFLKKER